MEHVNDIDDRVPRRVGIVGFGLAIPHLTGLFGGIGPGDPRAWIGTLWFVLLAAAIWHGNRYLLFRQRERLDWFANPIGKVVFLVVGCVFFTAPVTVGALLGWYRFAAMGPADWQTIGTVVLTNVICVLFVTHIYETVFLIKARHGDRLALERMQRTRAEAELAALRAQLDPHFLFNALNTLNWLIGRQPDSATAYTGRLAEVYRYILANNERELVLLRDELEFVDDYFHLHKVRFGEALVLDGPAARPSGLERHLVPPISVQLLIENAIKHNEFSERNPLRITIDLHGGTLCVRNELRPRKTKTSNPGVGLANLAERYRLLGMELRIERRDGEFIVELPLVEVGG